ncbi:primosomal replication protein N [Candidatus Schmidhempelia bombi]|jgi:primosomal replication protein N|uniref:Replication restart protein PriB n=1 Tax=Candidatus Schmidhempelia bombi str. Bimp TaxID=1387197 RepID=A0AB94IDV3_9GAMM|nr:primosomal replication protein N [Candidatus Schmidhempelia bombi]TEA27645.1 primosomal replication protein N [Candidatus Schmidhempelia bombi str. Bimp]
MTNRMVLAGIVYKTPIRKVSPNGIPHCQFYLEHVSEQMEAGLKRHAWCTIPVVISGHNELTNSIEKGSKICVSGFISLHRRQNNINQLILHADHIEFLGE